MPFRIFKILLNVQKQLLIRVSLYKNMKDILIYVL